VKGRYAHAFVHSPDRVTEPMVREGGEWRAVSWDEAIVHVANGLRSAIETHGPDSVGVLASARATNEENYLLQKFARVVLRTNNVDCCARVCHAPSAVALRSVFGTGAATNSFEDIELARTILVCGANATENHPVVGARIKQAARRGAALIVVDPRRIELADYADVHLQPRPGTNLLVLNAMAAAIVEEGLVDDVFVAERVEGLEAFTAHLAAYRPELVADACGVAAGDIRRAARLYATAKPSMAVHGLGVTEHTQGTDGVTAIANLALLTGNVGRRGAGVNPLRGQNNVQGSAHMGCEPDFLTGFTPRSDAARFEAVWGAPVPEADGLDAMEMIDAAGDGIRALWVVGWDIALTQPNMNATGAALDRLDLLVVQDLFFDETARAHATVFLPASSSFEKDGTFMNGERRVQRVRRAISPRGAAKSDWEIVCLVAAAMGHAHHFTYAGPSAIWDEVRAVWPPGAGLDWERLDGAGGLQWPCPTTDHPGTAFLHASEFGVGVGRAATLRPITYRATPEQTDADHPFVLVTGRALEQFNAGTMTGRSTTVRLRPTDLLEIAPGDAGRLGIADGDDVRVVSRYGSAVLPAEITPRVARGELFATFNDPRRAVNRLTGPHRDPHTHTPEYKVTAVRVEPVVRRE
jgi:formate dehydrogenase major subunit